MAILEAWDKFAQNITRRIASNVQLEEETFRVDYVLALYKMGTPQQKIWPEYPYPMFPKNGVDICVNVCPQQFMEIKYLMELATSSQRPRTKWLGMVLADVYKLTAWSGDAGKLVLLAIDRTFADYLRKKGLKVPDTGQDADHIIKLVEVPDSWGVPVSEGLPKTAIKELPEGLEKVPKRSFSFSWICCRRLDAPELSVCLLKIR